MPGEQRQLAGQEPVSQGQDCHVAAEGHCPSRCGSEDFCGPSVAGNGTKLVSLSGISGEKNGDLKFRCFQRLQGNMSLSLQEVTGPVDLSVPSAADGTESKAPLLGYQGIPCVCCPAFSND